MKESLRVGHYADGAVSEDEISALDVMVLSDHNAKIADQLRKTIIY